ncbi:cysteine proteinase [Vararia minispora EC-137]|uniref:Cysteine proteinase n=1 Tax=Vararia minispora EC-137 TaxID=1314806 RepID=A0ACB8QT37_9AGAM|nr:cysteine proteinase [Vararia minispora EC-137]
MFLHTLAFPQDISDLHYTPEHHMPVTPQDIYQSLVVNGKGSYCFGQNGLLLGILRGLGYRAYAVPGRVLVPSWAPGMPDFVYSALHHLVLLVQPHPAPLAAVTYVVDVGFGGTGTLRPVLLADGSAGTPQRVPRADTSSDDELVGGWVWGAYPPERHRVVRCAVDESLELNANAGDAPSRAWHMQVSHAAADGSDGQPEWKTLFTFLEIEFHQTDIDAGSFSVSNMPRYIFSRAVICTRRFATALQTEEDKAEVVARIGEGGVDGLGWVEKWSLEGAKITHRVGSHTVEEREVKTERERIETLRDLFGVGIKLEDEEWIKGRAAALV